MNYVRKIAGVPTLLLCCCFAQLIAAAALQEKPLVVIIPSYNNEHWVEKNLSSVFTQKYNNYRVIYIADCPTDNTVTEVRRIVAKYQQEDRFTLIINSERCGAMANWYTTIHSCDDEEIVVQLDGDDWFYNDQVLSYINNVYTARDIWMTYGQFIDYPSNVIGYEYSKSFSEKVIENNAFRKVEQLPMSHLRTCKAWLFKAIKLEDVLYQEQFYPMTCDKVMLACMVEMAAHHHYRVPDVLYVYNNNNAINDHRVNMQMQHSLAWHILSLAPYKQLTEPVYVEQCDQYDQVTAIVLCSEQAALQPALASIGRLVQGLHHIILLTPACGPSDLLQQVDKPVTVISYEPDQLVPILGQCLQTLDSRYVVLTTDTVIFDREIDMSACMRMLKKTQTNIFYLSLGNQAAAQTHYSKKLPLINQDHSMAAWYARSKNGSWTIPTIQMTLWQKDLLIKALGTTEASDNDALQKILDAWLVRNNVIGLMYHVNPIRGY